MSKNRPVHCDLLNVRQTSLEEQKLNEIKKKKSILALEKQPGLDITSKAKKKKIQEEKVICLINEIPLVIHQLEKEISW